MSPEDHVGAWSASSPGIASWISLPEPENAEGDERNRYYDPSIGRYLQPEPMLQNPKMVMWYARSGLQVNPYAYAGNNPLHFVDKNGLDYQSNEDIVAEMCMICDGQIRYTTDGSGNVTSLDCHLAQDNPDDPGNHLPDARHPDSESCGEPTYGRPVNMTKEELIQEEMSGPCLSTSFVERNRVPKNDVGGSCRRRDVCGRH